MSTLKTQITVGNRQRMYKVLQIIINAILKWLPIFSQFLENS